MLLTETFFQTFTKKQIVDAHKAVECAICIPAESKDAVNEMVNRAEAAGTTICRTPYTVISIHSQDGVSL